MKHVTTQKTIIKKVWNSLHLAHRGDLIHFLSHSQEDTSKWEAQMTVAIGKKFGPANVEGSVGGGVSKSGASGDESSFERMNFDTTVSNTFPSVSGVINFDSKGGIPA